jgi:N-acetylmuramoyl-L-alanine amidase
VLLTDLGAPLRAAGLPVMETTGWLARGHGPMTAVRSIICHHTAGPATGDTPSLRTVIDGRPGLAGPLCTLYLSRSGTWYLVSAGKAWHAGVVDIPEHSNEQAIGIEAEATGTSSWPPAQYESYAQGCAALAFHYRIPVEAVLGHKEVARPLGRKTDPNFPMPTFRDHVATYYRNWETTMTVSNADADVILGRGFNSGGDTGGHAGPTTLAETVILARNNSLAALIQAQTTGSQVSALTTKVDTLISAIVGTGGAPIDLDLLAAKVADLLAARLAS